MKKPFQILNTALTIILFSCGIQNAEIRGTIKNEVEKLSTSGSSLANEPEPVLSDPAVQGLFKVDRRDQQSKFQIRPSARTAYYLIDKSDLAKTMIRLNGPSGVN